VFFDRLVTFNERSQAKPLQPAESRLANLPTFHLVRIEPGKGTLGSPPDELDRQADEALHTIQFNRPLLVGSTEVTQGLWRAVMASDPVTDRGALWDPPIPEGFTCRSFGEMDDLPVFCVSWLDAVEFCNALSDIHGLDPAYKITPIGTTWNQTANGYRLPTEAEWEYIARSQVEGDERYAAIAGTSRDPDAICATANIAGRDTRIGHPNWEGEEAFTCLDGTAGLRAAPYKDAEGIHDLTGNLWEWVWDWYDPDYGLDRVVDPTGAPDGDRRVVRGGSWLSGPDNARVGNRLSSEPGRHSPLVGFRIVRSLRR
jgi:formylglycine-generating enzyme required for sulfatase activity